MACPVEYGCVLELCEAVLRYLEVSVTIHSFCLLANVVNKITDSQLMYWC